MRSSWTRRSAGTAPGKARRRESPSPLRLFHSPHEPIATDPDFTKLYANHPPKEAAYYGNVTQLDHEVGRLLRHLDARGATDDTLVFFSSDNGPVDKTPACRAVPRGQGDPVRGGIREPTIIRWPGKTRPGTVYEEPVAFVDWLTVCALAGAPVPTDRPIDGASFLPIFDGKQVERKGRLRHYLRQAAMRDGDWKIIGAPRKATSSLQHPSGPAGEERSRAREPGRLKAMSERFRALYAEILKEGGPITLANRGNPNRAGGANRDSAGQKK